MSALAYDLRLEAGATWTQVVTWKDSNGNLVNLTGYSGRMQIRPTVDSTTVIVELSSTGSGLTLGGSAGTITLTLPAATTGGYAAGQLGVYDLLLTDGAGTVTRLLSGSVYVSPAVTR